tara:strand:- start:834 stop:1085 length:252 start_codon:yes stop_codon:yes gene_type:complete
MKFRVEFNDGKTFSHYALVVFKVGLNITYVCSGVLIFGTTLMHGINHFQEFGPELLQEMADFYFPAQEIEQEMIDCMNCDEID